MFPPGTGNSALALALSLNDHMTLACHLLGSQCLCLKMGPLILILIAPHGRFSKLRSDTGHSGCHLRMSPGSVGHRLFADAWLPRSEGPWTGRLRGLAKIFPLPVAYWREGRASPEDHAELAWPVGEEE